MNDRAADGLAWVAPRVSELTTGRVLDVGCGDGRFLPAGGIGLDLDLDRLRRARARSLHVLAADARRLPFAASTFDTVYAHRMLNDTGDVDRALAEIVRVLRPGGRLVVFTRAREADGDRLDRSNGEQRLARHFGRVTREIPPNDDRAALFVAERPHAAD